MASVSELLGELEKLRLGLQAAYDQERSTWQDEIRAVRHRFHKGTSRRDLCKVQPQMQPIGCQLPLAGLGVPIPDTTELSQVARTAASDSQDTFAEKASESVSVIDIDVDSDGKADAQGTVPYDSQGTLPYPSQTPGDAQGQTGARAWGPEATVDETTEAEIVSDEGSSGASAAAEASSFVSVMRTSEVGPPIYSSELGCGPAPSVQGETFNFSGPRPSMIVPPSPKSSPSALMPPRGGISSGGRALKSMLQDAIEQQKQTGKLQLRNCWEKSDSELRRIRNRFRITEQQQQHCKEEEGKQKVRFRTRTISITAANPTGRRNSLLIRADQKFDLSSRWIMEPTSRSRLSWEITGGLLLLFDVIVVPLGAFPLPPVVFLDFMYWVIAVYWTFDIVMTCFTAYTVGTELERRWDYIVSKYVRGKLVFDLMLVSIDWVLLVYDLMAGNIGNLGLARTMRTARFVRMPIRLARLIRVVKLKHWLDQFKDRVNHEVVIMAINVAKLLMAALLSAHFATCVYYLVGDSSDKGWVEREHMFDKPLSTLYLYTAFRLMSRLHPTSMGLDLTVNTTAEKIFSMFATGSAVLMAAVMTSLITNLMAQARQMRYSRESKLAFIRSYAQSYQISGPLSMQLKKYIVTGYAAQLRQQNEAELIRVLPPTLVMDLRHETWSPVVTKHTLFYRLHDNHLRTEVDLCYRSMCEVFVCQDEVLFKKGALCGRMLFVYSGLFQYNVASTTLPDPMALLPLSADDCEPDHWPVLAGQWLSEAVLWIPWGHCGDLRAAENGSVCAILAEAFMEVVQEHEASLMEVVPYARAFVQKLNGPLAKLSDLEPDILRDF